MAIIRFVGRVIWVSLWPIFFINLFVCCLIGVMIIAPTLLIFWIFGKNDEDWFDKVSAPMEWAMMLPFKIIGE